MGPPLLLNKGFGIPGRFFYRNVDSEMVCMFFQVGALNLIRIDKLDIRMIISE